MKNTYNKIMLIASIKNVIENRRSINIIEFLIKIIYNKKLKKNNIEYNEELINFTIKELEKFNYYLVKDNYSIILGY